MENEKKIITRKPKYKLSVDVSEEAYNKIKASGFKQAFVMEEGIDYLLDRKAANRLILDENEEFKKSAEKLYKINSILQDKLFKAEKIISDLKALN